MTTTYYIIYITVFDFYISSSFYRSIIASPVNGRNKSCIIDCYIRTALDYGFGIISPSQNSSYSSSFNNDIRIACHFSSVATSIYPTQGCSVFDGYGGSFNIYSKSSASIYIAIILHDYAAIEHNLFPVGSNVPSLQMYILKCNIFLQTTATYKTVRIKLQSLAISIYCTRFIRHLISGGFIEYYF